MAGIYNIGADQVYDNNGTTINAKTGQPYAPATPTATPGSTPTPTTQPGTPSPLTIKDLYGSLTPDDQAINTAVGVYRDASQAPVDEQAIRDNVTKQLQAEIDATNSVYAEKLRQAQIVGNNNLGSNAAISARRGLLGSDFGAAANTKVEDDNKAVYSGIGDEQAAAIASITDKGNALAQQEIAAKNAVKQQSASDYISFLSTQDQRRTSRTTDAAQRALAAGIDLTTASPDDIKAIASSYQIAPDALVSSYVSAKNSAAAAQKANLTSIPLTDNSYRVGADGTLTQVQQGTATPDSALKEYQYAVQNDGYTGSLADWNSQKANQKVSDSVTHDPLTGALQVVQRAGPQVAGTGSQPKTPTPASTGLPSDASTAAPTKTITPAIPPTGTISNPYDKLTTSDLAYAQTGQPSLSKFKYPGQLDQAGARIRALIPGWTPANAAAQYAFFKSPATQTFIANSNTVLNTLDQIKALSDKVPRGSITILNGGQIGLAAGTSDPNAAKLVQLATIAGDEAGKLLGGSAGSDFTTQLGISLVNLKYGNTTFNATIDQLGGRVRNKVSEYYTQGGQTDPNGASSMGTGTPKGNLSDSDFVESSLTAQGADYNHVISGTPAGQIPVLLNSTGQIGYVAPSEFNALTYTKL
jgi:hypothetical protein